MNASKKRSGFAGDVLKLVSGTTVAQLLTLLVAPILTRLFAPDTWGVLAIFVSITSILGVIACLRYELAIMLPEKDEESANLLGVSLMFSVLVSLLIIPIIWFGKDPILRWLNAPGLAPYLWLVPIAVFLQGVFLALNYWNSRTRHFGRLSIARVISTLSTSLGKLSFGFAGYTSAGTMIGATVAGAAISTTILGGQIWRDDRNKFISAIRWREMYKGLIRYRRFPIFNTGAALLNTISVQLPPLLLISFFSPLVVGLYSLGQRLLTLPMNFIGGAIGQVFYQRAAVASAENTLRQVVEKTAGLLVIIGVFPFLLLAVIGPEFFVFVFGKEWFLAGKYVQILAPWYMCVFISSPISSLNSVLEKQAIGLLFNIIQVATRAGSLIIGGLTGNIILGLGLFSLSGFLAVIWFAVYHLDLSGVDLRTFGMNTLGKIAVAATFVMPVILLKYITNASIIYLLVGSALVTSAYYIFVILRNKDILKIVKQIIRRTL